MEDITSYNELSTEEREQIDLLIQTEFGHLDFITKLRWATPDYSVRKFENNELVAFYNVVLRTVMFNSKPQLTMGISNVITPIAHRGQKHSFNLLQDTQYKMLQQTCADFGLLLCSEDMIPFYNRLGWQELSCRIYHDQPSEKVLWPAKAMSLNLPELEIGGSDLLLNGPPW